MPYGVSKWPRGGDPRSTIFSLLGYDFGSVPPWKFLLATTGAQAPFDSLNEGVEIRCVLDEDDVTQYNNSHDDLRLFDLTLFKQGRLYPDPPTADWTVYLTVTAVPLAGDEYIGSLELTYPTAIQEFGPVTLIAYPGPGDLIPNGVYLTPLPWQQP